MNMCHYDFMLVNYTKIPNIFRQFLNQNITFATVNDKLAIAMKAIKRACFFIFLTVCILSCKKENDYSTLYKYSILEGELKETGKILILQNKISETSMFGTFSIVQNSAVVDAIPFRASVSKFFSFNIKGNIYEGKIHLKRKQITISLPDIPEYNIKAQNVVLSLRNTMPDKSYKVRYEEDVFTKIETIENVQYGVAEGYYVTRPVDEIANDDYKALLKTVLGEYKSHVIKGKKSLPLQMDIYQPKNDVSVNRPVFVMVHGGAFLFGDKQNLLLTELADHLVKKGYVVISPNYRLGSTLLGLDAIERTIYSGVQDIRAVLRYIVHHKDELRIDPKSIYLGGSSAGGIISLTTAFMDSSEIFKSVGKTLLRSDLGSLDTSGNSYSDVVKIAGVFSLWGALVDCSIIDNNPSVPTLMIHGTSDDIVPNGDGLPFKDMMGDFVHDMVASSWKLHGSQVINEYMSERSMPVQYIPLHGYGHEAHLNPDGTVNQNLDVIKKAGLEFLKTNVLESSNITIRGNGNVSPSDKVANYWISDIQKDIYWHAEGGAILKSDFNSAQVVWYSSVERGTLYAYIEESDGVMIKVKKNVAINSGR